MDAENVAWVFALLTCLCDCLVIALVHRRSAPARWFPGLGFRVSRSRPKSELSMSQQMSQHSKGPLVSQKAILLMTLGADELNKI